MTSNTTCEITEGRGSRISRAKGERDRAWGRVHTAGSFTLFVRYPSDELEA
jgi:hypothetical protein